MEAVLNVLVYFYFFNAQSFQNYTFSKCLLLSNHSCPEQTTNVRVPAISRVISQIDMPLFELYPPRNV